MNLTPRSRRLTPRELVEQNPMLKPHWRWDRAVYLFDRRQSPVRNRDDAETVYFLRYLRRLHQRGPRLPPHFAPIHEARRIYEQGGLERDILQARILTGQSLSEIAKLSGRSSAEVQAYVDAFFAVHPRLACKSWVVNQVLRYPRGLGVGLPLGTVLQKLGYFGGSFVVEPVIAYARQLHSRLRDPQPPGPPIPETAQERLIRRVLAVEMLTIDRKTWPYLMQLYLAQLRREKVSNDQAAAGEQGVEDVTGFLEFHIAGEQLYCALRADWAPPKTAVA